MKSCLKGVLLFLSTFVMIFASGGHALAMPDVVAKVGGIPVTKYELQRKFQKILPTQGGYHSGVPQERMAEIQDKAMAELIDQAYKVLYALNEEIAVDNASVEKRIEPMRSRFATDKEFAQALGSEGLSAFRASIYRELLAQKAEELAIDAKISVSSAQIREFYDKNKASYKRPKQFKASHILLKVDPASNKEEKALIKQRADDLAKRAKAGEDFYDLAYYNSDDRSKYVGGDLGYFHEGQTVQEFEEAILKMKPGEISDPVKTLHGYHIIKMVEVNEPRQLEFEEVKDKIRMSLEKGQREALYAAWMSGLKSKYQVQRFDK